MDPIFNIGNNIIDFFTGTNWHRVVLGMKIVAFVYSAALIYLLGWILKRFRDLRVEEYRRLMGTAVNAAPTEIDPEMQHFEHQEWSNVKTLWHSESAAEKRLALIDADALLDNVLHERGIPGETMKERLESIDMPVLSNMAEIAFAHRFRNELVHETGATFDLVDADRAFNAYEKALKELGII